MRRLVFVLLVFGITLTAANFKLYLKDGGFQVVREYRIEGDRVSYYSIDRSDWEEVPTALVDLKRTDAEWGARKAELSRETKEADDEKAAARELRQEILKIPRDPGAYQLKDGKLRVFPVGEATVHNSKGRTALRVLTGMRAIPGKATLELAGDHSTSVVTDRNPEFYLQLSEVESFGLVKLKPQKDIRIVESISTQPEIDYSTEQRDSVPIFSKQLSDNGLFKIWPQDALEPGEYAVVEYTEGKVNIQTWDFRIE